MHFHILGIGGTFMGGLAALLKELGHQVSGSDANIYPPMSTQLESLGIELFEGYADLHQLRSTIHVVVVGNVMKRGMPIVETVLNQRLKIVSGPECLAQYVLPHRFVFALSGTHGKTTLSSLLAWILEYNGLEPGFLIGGIPKNFGISARLGSDPYFIVEADEYDSAFFDKRSKFVHYHPQILVINNIEFDHADIFENIQAIQSQFHHLIRTVASKGLIVHPAEDETISTVLNQGCWTPCVTVHNVPHAGWWSKLIAADGSDFEIYWGEILQGRLQWSLMGQHNVQNALAAIAAAVGIALDPVQCIEALSHFSGVKRRLECIGQSAGISVYDDFAHHPTAVQMTLAGLKAKIGDQGRLIAVLDIRSNTMKAGHHQRHLPVSVTEADQVYFYYPPDLSWDIQEMWSKTYKTGGVYSDQMLLLTDLIKALQAGDHVVVMSNGEFGGIHTKILQGIK